MRNYQSSGHRQRLRERFLNAGLSGFHDYEIVELLLTLNTPRKDCKPMAKAAIKEFGGLPCVLAASHEDLQRINGIGSANAFGILLFRAVQERLTEEALPERIELRSKGLISDYLQKSIGNSKKENFVALYLDSQNRLIEHRTVSVGILDTALVHPREVFEPAVAFRAASIIVAHNHPSGDVEPSHEDREITRRLVDTGEILGIEVRDHIIVSNNATFSFSQQLLI